MFRCDPNWLPQMAELAEDPFHDLLPDAHDILQLEHRKPRGLSPHNYPATGLRLYDAVYAQSKLLIFLGGLPGAGLTISPKAG